MRKLHALFVVNCALSALAARSARAQLDFLPSIPAGSIQVRLKTAPGGFDGFLGDHQTPTDIAAPTEHAGRLFVAMQLGKIRVVDFKGNLLPDVFLDTRSAITPDQPHFFTSLAFHKQFTVAGRPGYGKFYTLELEHPDTAPADFAGSLKVLPDGFQQVLYEYTMNDITANVFEGTKREVLRVDRPGPGSGHNMGDLQFGRDGYLYIANGDGGNNPNTGDEVSMADNAQYSANIYGKVLRIDPVAPELKPRSADPVSANGKYRVPANNPFLDDPDPNTPEDETVDEIYAYGFRNPYRMTFDRLTDQMYVGSVGQHNIESVYQVLPALNHGWNLKEGSFIYDRFDQDNLTPDVDLDLNGLGDFAEAHGLVDPLFEYDHQDGVAVMGGFVYRGKQLPDLYGKYVFGDFAGGEGVLQGRLFYGDPMKGEIFEMQLTTDSEPLPGFVYSFGQDKRGELYVAGTSSDGSRGIMLKLVPPTVKKGLGSTAVPEPHAILLAGPLVAGLAVFLRRARARKARAS